MKTKKAKAATNRGVVSAPGCSALLIAFVQGAKFWEYHKTGATMWQSDQTRCEKAAAIRLEHGILGENPDVVGLDCAARKRTFASMPNPKLTLDAPGESVRGEETL